VLLAKRCLALVYGGFDLGLVVVKSIVLGMLGRRQVCQLGSHVGRRAAAQVVGRCKEEVTGVVMRKNFVGQLRVLDGQMRGLELGERLGAVQLRAPGPWNVQA